MHIGIHTDIEYRKFNITLQPIAFRIRNNRIIAIHGRELRACSRICNIRTYLFVQRLSHTNFKQTQRYWERDANEILIPNLNRGHSRIIMFVGVVCTIQSVTHNFTTYAMTFIPTCIYFCCMYKYILMFVVFVFKFSLEVCGGSILSMNMYCP